MEALNDLEITLLGALITKYPSLKTHIPYLRVVKREITGKGMMVHFTYTDFASELESINVLFSNGEKIEVSHLKDGLSYAIDVTAGSIEHIEFSTYNENWDGLFNDYKIVENELNK